MSDPKAERLAAIRAANAQRRQAPATIAEAPEALVSPAAAPEPLVLPAVAPEALVSPAAAPEPLVSPAVAPEPLVSPAAAPEVPTAQPVPPVAPAAATADTIRLAPVRGVPAEVGEVSSLTFGGLALIGLSAVGGALLGVVLPNLLPGLRESLLGPEPKAYWYLSRSTAFVAYALLWLSMVLGLMMTNKLARLWPGGPLAFELHEHSSILGLAFGLFHALILLGDGYASYTLAQILVPFAAGGAAALWLGLGQLSLYLMGIVGLSFYVRPLIGRAGWRLIHFLSFATFALTLLHGVLSGSDTGTPVAQAIYWLSGGSLLFLTIYRVLAGLTRPAPVARTS